MLKSCANCTGAKRNEVLTNKLRIRVWRFLKKKNAHAKSMSLPVVSWVHNFETARLRWAIFSAVLLCP